MDEYTRDTQAWLNQRFTKTDSNGVYIAHQPIYGFRGGPSEPNVISRYARFYGIIHWINRCRFESFLDVGGAEGYQAAFVKRIYHPKRVVSVDLSEPACQRAHQLYQLDTRVADIHDLPFTDNSFDLVLCSETIEHVTDPARALRELIRVAKRCLIVTTPYEHRSSHLTKAHNSSVIPHGHINQFSESDLKSWLGPETKFDHLRYRPLIPIMVMAEGPDLPTTVTERYPVWLIWLYYRIRWLSKITNIRLVSALVSLDRWLSKRYPQRTSDLLAFCELTPGSLEQPLRPEAELLERLLNDHVISINQNSHVST